MRSLGLLLCALSFGCAAPEPPRKTYGAEPSGVRVIPGMWRPHYPFEHIAWVSPPWPSQDYVWLDFPEAVFTRERLLFLSHVNPMFPVAFPDPPPARWRSIPGGVAYERLLPDGVSFGGSVRATPYGARLELFLENGSGSPLREIRLQTCAFLRAIEEFADFTFDTKFVHLVDEGWQPFAEAQAANRENGRFRLGWRGGPASADLPVMAATSRDGDRLVAFTWFDDTYSLVSNPSHPCIHADPAFPDLAPGGRAVVRGELIFFEGGLEEFTGRFEEIWARERAGRNAAGGEQDVSRNGG